MSTNEIDVRREASDAMRRYGAATCDASRARLAFLASVAAGRVRIDAGGIDAAADAHVTRLMAAAIPAPAPARAAPRQLPAAAPAAPAVDPAKIAAAIAECRRLELVARQAEIATDWNAVVGRVSRQAGVEPRGVVTAADIQCDTGMGPQQRRAARRRADAAAASARYGPAADWTGVAAKLNAQHGLAPKSQ